MLSSLKSIAYLVGEGRQDEAVAGVSVGIARKFGAHVTGAYILSTPDRNPAANYARGSEAIRSTIKHVEGVRQQVELEVHSHVAGLSVASGVRIEGRVVDAAFGTEDMTMLSLKCDLIVTQRHESGAGSVTPERLLLVSGLPILVLPPGWKGSTVGRRVVVAWNASREARRGVTDAMPFLSLSEEVIVLIVDSEQALFRHRGTPGSDIAGFLARHEVAVSVVTKESNGSSVAETILAYARGVDADLLVIGAYSHARIVEKLIGGVTRELLGQADIPLLISR